MRKARIWATLAVLAACAALSGCAAMNYATYADKQAVAIKQIEATRAARAAGIAQIAAKGDAAQRQMGMLLLFVQSVLDKPHTIEPPREGLVERGINTALSGLPYVGLVNQMGQAMRGHGGGSYQQTISGSGAGGALNTGGGTATASPATAAPTVVEQPRPVVVGD